MRSGGTAFRIPGRSAEIQRMIVVWAREIPRSAIISTRSRKLSLNRRYQRTQRMMISRSKWRPLKRSSMLNMLGQLHRQAILPRVCPASAICTRAMGETPLIMALANPTPEIEPGGALAARPDAMICTGRSDYPNQVNNVLCFPYMFRGALDVAASTINEAMKLAAVRAIAQLAHEPPSDVVAKAYGGEARQYGKDSLIPSPFDPRLILRIAPAVAKAAMETGVAKKPITDFVAYEETLSRFVFRSGFIMKPLMQAAKANPKRVIYAEGEDERVLRAVQTVVEEGIAKPILIGRPEVIDMRLDRFGLSVRRGRDFELVNPNEDPRYRDYVATYLRVCWTARNHAQGGAHLGADQFDGDRGDRREARRRRCHALRPRRTFQSALAIHQGHYRARSWRDRSFRDVPRDHQ